MVTLFRLREYNCNFSQFQFNINPIKSFKDIQSAEPPILTKFLIWLKN